MSIYRVAIATALATTASTVELQPIDESYPTGKIALTDADGDGVWTSSDQTALSAVGDYDLYIDGSSVSGSQTEANNMFFGNKAIVDLSTAANINYSNASSGLSATTVQAAIDELDTAVDGITGLTADSVNDTHIDWGVGTNQVSAGDVPVAAADANPMTGNSGDEEIQSYFQALNSILGVNSGNISRSETTVLNKVENDVGAMLRALDAAIAKLEVGESLTDRRVVYADQEVSEAAAASSLKQFDAVEASYEVKVRTVFYKRQNDTTLHWQFQYQTGASTKCFFKIAADSESREFEDTDTTTWTDMETTLDISDLTNNTLYEITLETKRTAGSNTGYFRRPVIEVS